MNWAAAQIFLRFQEKKTWGQKRRNTDPHRINILTTPNVY
jgi:hypothetical protein